MRHELTDLKLVIDSVFRFKIKVGKKVLLFNLEPRRRVLR